MEARQVLQPGGLRQTAAQLDADQVDEPYPLVCCIRHSSREEVGGLQVAVRQVAAVQLAHEDGDAVDTATEASAAFSGRQRVQVSKESVQIDDIFDLLGEEIGFVTQTAPASAKDGERACRRQAALAEPVALNPRPQRSVPAQQVDEWVAPGGHAETLVDDAPRRPAGLHLELRHRRAA